MREWIITTTGLVLLVAVISDFRTMRIPNILTFGAMGAGVALNSAMIGIHGATFAFLGMLTGIGTLLVPFIFRGMGGGDVKLMGAVGALMGPAFALSTFLFGSIAGGIVALGRLAVKSEERADVWMRLRIVSLTLAAGVAPKPVEMNRRGFPYAICIAAGAVITVILSFSHAGFQWVKI